MYFIDTPPQLIPLIAQLEETPVIKKRKPREPKHDFKDGDKKVLARKHAYGGGWVAATAKVDDTVYVGRRCEIFNRAIVKGAVRLEGNAKISGSAVVSGNVILRKNAHVYGKAVVRDTTEITDDARVFGEAHVSGTSLLFDTAVVFESAQVFSTTLRSNTSVSGNALVARSDLNGAGCGIEIKGDCSVIHGNIRGRALINGQAQFIRSNISNISMFPVDIADFVVIADQSYLYSPIIIRNHVVLIHSTIHHYPIAQNTQAIQLSGRSVFQHQSFRNRVELENYINLLAANGGRLGAAQIMPNGQIAPAAFRRNDLNTPPAPRRLMRMQEAAV